MAGTILEESLNFVQEYLNENLDSRCVYHNFEHTLGVVKAATLLGKEAKLSALDQEDLILAASFHDIGYAVDRAEHETLSAEIANGFLIQKDLAEERRKNISETILATKLGYEGSSPMQLLIQDADMYGLASENYKAISQRLKMENNELEQVQMTDALWLKKNIDFFKAHKYQSKAGKKLFNKGKKKNLKKLIQELGMSKKEEKLQTIASSKSAQTQLKTALRNHIDLSSIADNKANIMLSVNAIVITVGLPLLIDRMGENPKLMIPTAIVAISSLISMVFATLATRPIKMTGLTNLDQIQQKKSNLFFFGNFYNMKFDEYETGIKSVISNNEILDNSITRDLFFLGKSLGHKYDKLRICYNVFMVGLVLAVLAFALLAIVN